MTSELHICLKLIGWYISRESWHNMHIAFPIQYVNGDQVYSGYEHMYTTKFDYDFCFLPDSSIYWISYLVGRIQTWIWGPWSFGTGSHIFWERHGCRLHLGWQPLILSRDAYGTCWDTFLRVKRWIYERLGACPCPWSVFAWYYVGVVDK